MLPDADPPVRPAGAADGPFLAALAARLVGPWPLTTRDPAAVVSGSERLLEGALERACSAPDGVEPGSALLVAEGPDGELLGCVQVQEGTEYFSGEPEAYVGVLAVAEAAERKGVGRALMRAAEAWAADRGLRRLSLEVFAGNEGARAFYRRLGFEEDSLRLVRSW